MIARQRATPAVGNDGRDACDVDETSLKEIADLYATFVEQVRPVSRPCVAELAKLVENTLRHVNISRVNELAMFARELGIAIGAAATGPPPSPIGQPRRTRCIRCSPNCS